MPRKTTRGPRPIPKPQRVPKQYARLERRAPIIPRPLVPASDAQRSKVALLRCAVCESSPVDPAHLVPRKHGGCDHPDCVLPLCRTHHRLYDAGELSLGLYLGRGWRKERSHARSHVSAARLRRALDGHGWD